MEPYVDEHHLTIDESRDLVWAALHRYVDSALVGSQGSLLKSVLGTVPRSGFGVAREVPGQQIELSGRHRFSRYRLVFELTDTGEGETVLSAKTYAEFPGLHGRVYRALVIGSRAHVVAVQGMLRAIRRGAAI
jgi:hypothetical protein